MNEDHDVLEDNVSTLLESGGARPQLAPKAKARIRAELVGRYSVRARRPIGMIALGLSAAVAAALVVLHFIGGDAPQPLASIDSQTVQQVAGAELVRGPDASVTELGPRHLRVSGAVLIDVAPGHGAFTVETAQGRIAVLGTRFLVDAAPGRTTTAVVRGEVQIATGSGDVTLHAGEQAVAEPGHPPVRGPAPRLSHLVSWAREARHRAEQALPVHHG
ncbi:MAG TPA: FecR family protein, partial [Kofleriaceae bacterium]